MEALTSQLSFLPSFTVYEAHVVSVYKRRVTEGRIAH